MDTSELESINVEFHLANTEAAKSSPRSTRSGASSSEVFGNKYHTTKRPLSARKDAPPSKAPITRSMPPSSSIPLPVKTSGPIKISPTLKSAKPTSRPSSISITRTNTVNNKHTLEIQFLNKNKRYVQMRKDLLEKQKPVLDLYQNLLSIKKRLEEVGKHVLLEEFRLISTDGGGKRRGGGEQMSPEVIIDMRTSIEEIPKTLMDICRNLLSKRALIVELLESVTKSEVDMTEVSDKIETLKNEGQHLRKSLDAVINEHQGKINDLVTNWQKLLNDRQTLDADSKISELEAKLKDQERLTLESNHVVHDLQKRLEDKRTSYDRSVAELNGIIQTLKEQIKKLEQDLEGERKVSVDIKSRNNTNSQNLKTMRSKVTDLEQDKKNMETANAELQKKLRYLQEQMKQKETQWAKDKEEMNKNLKHQENMLQKLTADKSQFETRLGVIEDQKSSTEEELRSTIETLDRDLKDTRDKLEVVTVERDEILTKCTEFEVYLARMGLESKETMNKVSYSIEWGNAHRDASSPEAENYLQDIAKDLRIRELEDRIRQLERDSKLVPADQKPVVENLTREPTDIERQLYTQQECLAKYQMLLAESENKLKEKSAEVTNLRSELRQLKVRQDILEEQNSNCPTEELQSIIEEGRIKLNELMKKSMESEQKIEQYEGVIERQSQQICEMENSLRYRENMAGYLKASRDELVFEKESLTRYSEEMRSVLAEVVKEGKMKDRFIKDLQEQIDLRERQINKLEKEVRDLEAKLMMTCDKRFKLQEAVTTLEKELQRTKARVNQLADINTRYENQLCHQTSYILRASSNCQLHQMSMVPNNHLGSFRQIEDVTLPDRDDSHNHNQFTPNDGYSSLDGTQNSSYHPSSDQSAKTSSTFRNSSIFNNEKSQHVSCHHYANSRSLIGVSLQTVDLLKTRLNYLTTVNFQLPDSTDEPQRNIAVNTCSTQTLRRGSKMLKHSLSKILELTAKRYEYLQNQANSSYEDLTSLVKLAMNHDDDVKN